MILALLAAAVLVQVDDPAPPVVRAIDDRPLPTPRHHAALTAHSAPRALAEGAVVEAWGSLLGPSHRPVSRERPLRASFGAKGPPLRWEMAAGAGYCSPAVRDPFLVFLHRLGDEEVVECLHCDTGQKLWEFRYPTAYVDGFGYSNGPRCPPVLGRDRVYCYGAEGKLHCLFLPTGQLLWQRDLPAEFGAPLGFFGVGSTPLLHDGRLIVNIGAPGGPCVIALDAESGLLQWTAGKEWGASYASPVPARLRGQERVLVFAGGESRPPHGGLLCLDPATGALDFRFPWRSRSYASVNSSCPVVWNDSILLSASYQKGSVLLDLDESMQPTARWQTTDFGLHFQTALVRDGHAYGFEGRNEPDTSFACLDLATGAIAWREWPTWDETFERQGVEYTRPLGYHRGQLLDTPQGTLCLGELGHLAWLELSPEGYTERSRAMLFLARESWSLMVLHRGLLYLRQNTRDLRGSTGPRLLCYDLRGD